jgi:ferredoxin--NADP+ reductase/benzoate/toluate 1,2-dioxygenase reductase subunit
MTGGDNPIRAPIPVRTVETTVLASRALSETGFALTLDRHDIHFRAGMLLTIHSPDPTEDRDYTIASGEQDPHLQILYRYIPTGRLTSRLVQLQPGHPVRLSAPYGRFTLQDPHRPIVFVATGTGIAPARSYLRSHPTLDLTILHGARNPEDLFYATEFAHCQYHPCLSRHPDSPQHVTTLLESLPLPPDAHFYLCGAYEMIFDATQILTSRGIPPTHIFTEAYYYHAAQ